MNKQLKTKRSFGRRPLLATTTWILLTSLICFSPSKLSASPTPANELKMTGTYIKLTVTPDNKTASPASQAKLCASFFKKKFTLSPHNAIFTAGEDFIEVYVNTTKPKDLKEIKEHLTYRGKLSIHLVHRESRKFAEAVATKKLNIPDYIALPYSKTNIDDGKTLITNILTHKKPELTEKDVKIAYIDPRDYSIINIELHEAGGNKMHAFTSSLTKGIDMIATVLNGEVVNYATLNADSLSKRFVITGLDSKQEAEKVINSLQSPLASTLQVIEQRTFKTHLQPNQ